MKESDIKNNVRSCLEAAQKAGKFKGSADLGRKVSQALKDLSATKRLNHFTKQTISDQTASNWINGKVIPTWDVLPALEHVIDVPEDAILFGPKRDEQIRKEREFLARVSEEELRLLTIYRETSKPGQKTIIKQAKLTCEDHPAPEATVHPMRRKEDKLKP